MDEHGLDGILFVQVLILDIIELIDKNTLYINYADIDDSAYEITDEVKAFNRSFYKKGE